MDLTPAQIVSQIRKATPFHREEVTRSFENYSICWKLKFKSIRKGSGDIYHVTLSAEEGNDWNLVFCDVVILDYPQFKFMEEGYVLSVNAKISSYSLGMGFTLKDVAFLFDEGKNHSGIAPESNIHISNSQIHLGNGNIHAETTTSHAYIQPKVSQVPDPVSLFKKVISNKIVESVLTVFIIAAIGFILTKYFNFDWTQYK